MNRWFLAFLKNIKKKVVLTDMSDKFVWYITQHFRNFVWYIRQNLSDISDKIPPQIM